MRLMIDRILFSLFGALIAGVGYRFGNIQFDFVVDEFGKTISERYFLVTFLACLIGAVFFYIIYPEIIKFFKMLQKGIQRVVRRFALTDVVILIIALILTIVIYIFIEPILRFMLQDYADLKLFNFVTFLTTPILFIILWMIGVAKRDAIVKATRGFIGSDSGTMSKELYVIDSSSLIDGRIAELLATSTFIGRFAVPSFVLVDLQRIADSPDPLLAHRGKRGMQTVESLQETIGKRLEVIPSPSKGRHSDLLAKMTEDGARVISCDKELTEEIRARGGVVVNLNEAASALKTIIVPGEIVPIRVIKEGKEQNQGIGFLDDGTMVVVEDGNSAIGKDVKIICTSLLQNPQGRIVFGRLVK